MNDLWSELVEKIGQPPRYETQVIDDVPHRLASLNSYNAIKRPIEISNVATNDAHPFNVLISIGYLAVVPPEHHNLVPPRNQTFSKRLRGDLRPPYYSRIGGRSVDDVGD